MKTINIFTTVKILLEFISHFFEFRHFKLGILFCRTPIIVCKLTTKILKPLIKRFKAIANLWNIALDFKCKMTTSYKNMYINSMVTLREFKWCKDENFACNFENLNVVDRNWKWLIKTEKEEGGLADQWERWS